MGRFLMRLEDDLGAVYFEWSTVVDAPVSPGFAGEEELRAWLIATGEPHDEERFQRLRRPGVGTSAHDQGTAEDIIAYNRAGPHETHLSRAALIAQLRAEHREYILLAHATNPESETSPIVTSGDTEGGV